MPHECERGGDVEPTSPADGAIAKVAPTQGAVVSASADFYERLFVSMASFPM